MERLSEIIEYLYVEPNDFQNETHSDEVMFDQSHDQINLQMVEIEQESSEQPSGSNNGQQKESWGRPGRKAAVPDEALDEKALNRRNRRRMRNREAAQRQRDRRVSQLNQLQEKNTSLIEENDKLKDDMKIMDEKYKRALFKIQSMQKVMSNCACKNSKEPSPLGVLNGATKKPRKRSSIELPIIKMTLKPSQPMMPKCQPEAKNISKVATAALESQTPEKTINKYIQYLKTGPFEQLNLGPTQPPSRQSNLESSTSLITSEPPMKKPRLIDSDRDFHSQVFADVFFKKPVQTIDITKTAIASEGAISKQSSVHKFC